MPPGRRWRAIASKLADAMHPQLEQSGLPPNWQGRSVAGICGQALRRPRKRALGRRSGRPGVGLQGTIEHLELWYGRTQPPQFIDDPLSIQRREALFREFSPLWRVQAHPEHAGVDVRLPEPQELFEVARPTDLLAFHRAVHRDLMSCDVFENSIVRRRRAPLVMFGRQSVHGHDDLQAAKACPLAGNGPHGARDELCVDVTCRQYRENGAELAIADERLSADDGHVQGIPES